MKFVKLIIFFILIFINISNAQSQHKNSIKPKIITSHIRCLNVDTIVVPIGISENVFIDGDFSKSEWDDALTYSVAENYKVYFKADSIILCIGLKSSKPIGELVCEIRITSNEKDVFYYMYPGNLEKEFPAFQQQQNLI